MSLNKHQPHILVIPEDRADERIANGFIMHSHVMEQRIRILPPAGGWLKVLEQFEGTYINYLQKYQAGVVVLLIDFDGDYQSRRDVFRGKIPEVIMNRVFVLGALESPEILRRSLSLQLEQIGTTLAAECLNQTTELWNHDLLRHNEPDRRLLANSVREILFTSSISALP